MGAHPWYCSMEFMADLDKALQVMRYRELRDTVGPEVDDMTDEEKDETIAEMVEAADADGTCSILDIEVIRKEPEELECGTATPLSKEQLIEYFGTDKPNSEDLGEDKGAWDDIYDEIGRGQAVYVIGYKDNKPATIVFAGYSYD